VKLLLALTLALLPSVITDGHVDLGARFADGTFQVQLRDDTADPAVWRDLSDTVLHVVDAAAVTVPADPAFAFLGPAGTRVWVLPQTQQPGIVWPGWNTQDPTVVERVDREVTWRLRGVDGPGTFSLFLTGEFGTPEVVFDSAKPYPQETGIEVGSHVHGNWVFGAPGAYRLDIEMLATTVDGDPVRDRAELRLFVGPGDSAAAFAGAEENAEPPTESEKPPPATAEPPAAAEAAGNSGAGPWVLGGVLVVLAGAGGSLWLRRRRS
jgi:putative ABC transporter-associated repeat protein